MLIIAKFSSLCYQGFRLICDCPAQVTGCVTDGSGQARWLIKGTWDGSIEIAPVTAIEGTPENPVYKTGNYFTVWKKNEVPSVHFLSQLTLC